MDPQPASEQLGRDSIPWLLWRFSLPAIVGTMVHATYSIVDRIYLGHAVGTVGIAATTVSFPMMLILMAFGMLIAHGGNSLVSIRLGERRQDEAERVLGQAVTLLAVLSVVFTVGGLIFLNPLLRLFGATATILPAAEAYMRIILFGTVTHEISFAMNNFIRGEGSPRVAMLTMVIGAGLNLVLDPIFLFGFGWGMEGAAWATVISQTVSAVWVMSYYFGGRSQLKIRLANLKLHWALVRQIAAVGSPPFVMQLIGSVTMLLMNQQLKIHGGDDAIAAMGIIFSCNMIFFMPIIGMCMGMQPIVGYNHGARRFDRVRQCVLLAMGVATLICVLSWIPVQAIPQHFIGLFGEDIPEVVALGSHGMRIFLLLMPIIGFQVIAAHYYQAVGKAGMSLLLSLIRQGLLRIPLIVFLPMAMQLEGVWWSGPLADLGAALLTAIFIIQELRNLKRQAENPDEPIVLGAQP